jgi:hypothetical protein
MFCQRLNGRRKIVEICYHAFLTVRYECCCQTKAWTLIYSYLYGLSLPGAEHAGDRGYSELSGPPMESLESLLLVGGPITRLSVAGGCPMIIGRSLMNWQAEVACSHATTECRYRPSLLQRRATQSNAEIDLNQPRYHTASFLLGRLNGGSV